MPYGEEQPGGALTVPIVLDSEHVLDSEQRDSSADLLRCVYFYISTEDPDTGWTLRTAQLTVPFLMLGLQGIICHPTPQLQEFSTPDLLNDLIHQIEDNEVSTVESGCLLLPAGLLDRARQRAEDTGRHAERGDVFRLNQQLFNESWHAVFGNSDLTIFVHKALELDLDAIPPPIRYSAVETRSFQAWSQTYTRPVP